jgi:hypothetical protein
MLYILRYAACSARRRSKSNLVLPTAHRSLSNRWEASQTRVVAAIIEAALSENPPRRLLLGSDAYGLVTEALNQRLATFERQRFVAFSTDIDQGEDASLTTGLAVLFICFALPARVRTGVSREATRQRTDLRVLHFAQDFGSQAFHLLGVVEEQAELDEFGSRIRDLAQPGDAG